MPRQPKYRWGSFIVTLDEVKEILDLYTLEEIKLFYNTIFTSAIKYELKDYLYNRIIRHLQEE